MELTLATGCGRLRLGAEHTFSQRISAPDSLAVFFTSIDYGRVASRTYNTLVAGENCWPSVSGVQVPDRPAEHGVMNNLTGR